MAGKNSWAASLQPAAFYLGKMGSSFWKRGSLGQLRAVPLPSTEQDIALPCCEGLQEAGAALGVWSGSKHELLMSGGVPKLRCESQAARAGEHAEDSVVKG